MNVWRVSDYADLSGQGGIVAAARWHRAGTPVVYCADHPATALLEKLVHIDVDDMPRGYTLLTIDVPDAPIGRVEVSDLPSGWMTDLAVTQTIGSDLLERAEHLLVWIPSVLVPRAWNALLNPKHADAARCTVVDTISNLFDPRLIR
jgi:RES domain-containing protein